jgi:hypothetical protein
MTSSVIRSAVALTLATLVAATACGSPDDPADRGSEPVAESPDASSGGPLPAEAGAAFCQATFGKFVEAFTQCCTTEDRTTTEYTLSADLFERVTAACGSKLGAGLQAGRLAHDPAAADACYSAYQAYLDSIPCATVPSDSPDGLGACAAVFTGLVPAGAACAGDHECVDGLTCVGWAAGRDGVCKIPPAIGEACGEGESEGDGGVTQTLRFGFGDHPRCAPDAYCGSRVCRAKSQLGATCSRDEQCADAASCRRYECSHDPLQGIGGVCRGAQDCTSDLFCAQSSVGAEGTCQPKKSDGDACGLLVLCKGRCDRPDGGAEGTCRSYCGSG